MGWWSLSAKNRVLMLLVYVLGVFGVWALVGCGGSGASMSGGSVALKIAWPEPSRYIPPYAKSISFALYSLDDPQSPPRLIVANRPDTLPLIQTVEFVGPIPSGSYSLTGLAMTGKDGNGTTVASASDIVFVQPTGITTVALTLATNLASIELLDMPLSMSVGQLKALNVKVLDKDNNTVILPNGALTWSVVFGGSRITLSNIGAVTAVSAGSARVRVSEIGAGLYSDGDITVSP
jgi:hypothetical protein